MTETVTVKTPHVRRAQVLIALLLVLGLYLPTSIDGDIAKPLMEIGCLCVLSLYACLLWLRGLNENLFMFISLPIVMILMASTFLSHVYIFGLGELWLYTLVALLYATRLRCLRFGKGCKFLFDACNVVNITLGACIVFHVARVDSWIVSYYSNFFPDLVPEMLAFGKPVMTFATHSLAAFFLFLFFWLNFRTYLRKGRLLSLSFAIFYAAFEPCLLSVSGFGFGFLALLVFGVHLWRRNAPIVIAATLAWFLFLPTIVHVVYPPIDNWQGLVDIARPAFTEPGEGFLGRYGSEGNNVDNLKYVSDHPLSPTGLTTSGNLFIGDSGPVEYLVRGSIVLLALMYVGLFKFLSENLAWKSDVPILFAAILTMEFGFTSLTYLRMLYLLPFAVIYLNSLEDFQRGDTVGRSMPDTLRWRAGIA